MKVSSNYGSALTVLILLVTTGCAQKSYTVKDVGASVAVDEMASAVATETTEAAAVAEEIADVQAVETTETAETGKSQNEYHKVIIEPLAIEQPEGQQQLLSEKDISTLRIKFFSALNKQLPEQWTTATNPVEGALRMSAVVKNFAAAELAEGATSQFSAPIVMGGSVVEVRFDDAVTGETVFSMSLPTSGQQELTEQVADWSGMQQYINYWASMIGQELSNTESAQQI